jgi:Phage-related tail fibre protein
MAEVRQKMRGTTLANDQYIGAEGQITVDTTKNALRVHDGVTVGGHEIPNLSMVTDAIQPQIDALQAQVDAALAQRVGEVIICPVDPVPSYALEANGAAVSRTTYARLFAKIGTRYGAGNGSTTFNLPDYRGEFLRGWDHGRGLDPGRNLGTVQMSQNLSHTHGGAVHAAGAHGHNLSINPAGEHRHSQLIGFTGVPIGTSPNLMTPTMSKVQDTNTAQPVYRDSNDFGWVFLTNSGNHGHTGTAAAVGDHVHGLTINADGGSEARPRNISVMFCIIY